MTFKEVKFKNFVTLQRGFDLPKRARIRGDYPVVGSTSIDGYHNEFKVGKPGVVTGRSGSLGEVLYIKENFWPLNTALWVRDFKGNNPRFVYYYLKTMDLARYNSGVGVPTLNRNHLDNVLVRIPEREYQNRIADVLSCFDDLIEVNFRRIEILEEITQSLYNEWFVNLRYPGHENAKIINSEFGKIPEGWQVKKIKDICSFVSRGVTPKYERGSGRYIINQKANRGLQIERSYLKELKNNLDVPEEKSAHKGDLLINSLGEGTIGRVHHFRGPHKEWAVDQHMTICRSEPPSITNYLYYEFSSKKGQERIQSVKTGATNMTMLNISVLRNMKFIIPPKALLERFFRICNSISNLIYNLENKNYILTQTRYSLLPRLITGKIDVSELDIQVPSD